MGIRLYIYHPHDEEDEWCLGNMSAMMGTIYNQFLLEEITGRVIKDTNLDPKYALNGWYDFGNIKHMSITSSNFITAFNEIAEILVNLEEFTALDYYLGEVDRVLEIHGEWSDEEDDYINLPDNLYIDDLYENVRMMYSMMQDKTAFDLFFNDDGDFDYIIKCAEELIEWIESSEELEDLLKNIKILKKRISYEDTYQFFNWLDVWDEDDYEKQVKGYWT